MKVLEQKYAKYAIAVCLSLCVIITLTFMLSRPEDPNADDMLSTVSNGDLSGNHFYKVYSDSFTADAEITTDYNDKAEVVYAGIKSLDEKTLLSLFFKGENPVRAYTEGTDKSSENVSYAESGSYENEFMSIFLCSTSYISQDYKYYEYPTENFAAKYEYYSTLPMYSEIYTQKELSFMSRDDAIAEAKEVLQKLEIDVADDVEVYAIDCKTMQAYQDEHLSEDPFYRESYDIKDTFTEDDEFYMMFFTSVYDGVPITYDSYEIMDGDRGMDGTVIKMCVSKKGVIYFYTSFLYDIQSVAETPNSLITAQEAVDKVFDAYNSIVTDEKLTVKEVKFEYVPVAYNDNLFEVKLTPSWTVVLSGDVGELEGIITHRHINAVTGEEIK